MPLPSGWRSYWRRLTEPAPGIEGEDRQRARLLITLAMALLLIAPLAIVGWAIASPQYVAARWISAGLYAGLIGTYLLSRTRRYQLGAYLLVAVLLLLVPATVMTGPGPIYQRMLVLQILPVIILLASLALSIRVAVVIAGICIAGTLTFFAIPAAPAPTTYAYLVFQIVISALMIAATALRNAQVSARQQALAALHASEERFRHLTLHSPDTIYIVDLAGAKIVFVNRDEFLGFRIGELEHASALVEHAAPEDRERIIRAWRDLNSSQSDEVLQIEYRVRSRAGAWEWVQQRGVVIGRAAAGAPTQLLIALTLITDRKRLEEQVVQAQKMEAIGRLAGGVAHDFNNLLTVINGYADMLLATMPADEPARLDVAEIAAAGGRAAALTRQLLTFSRQRMPEVTVVSLHEVVRQAETMLRRVIGEGVALEVRLAADAYHLRANPDQLGQVLLNLAVNARDAMPRGGRLMIATVDQLGPGGREVVLTVADTGDGMPPEVLARAFEPFFSTKGPGGTGLGLAVVHGIVAQAGGTIAVESEPGRGTVFRIALPACAAEAAAPASAQPAAPGGGETVLLVEDDPAVRQIAERSLREGGYRVLAPSGAAEALALGAAELARVDLVLADVVLPGLSGPELVAELRRAAPRLRAIYMSGYAPDALGHGLGEDAQIFLAKPFGAEELARKVREALDA